MTEVPRVAADEPGPDRRQRRRRQTIAEILEVALEVMGEEGVGGLSLSEVARRMDIQPPSLYKYFSSKLAVYDALFADGVRQQKAAVEAAIEGVEPGLPALRAGTAGLVRWSVEHPVLAQLLFWRPVPGFEPSAEAFAPAVEVMDDARQAIQDTVDRGQLHPDAASDRGLALFTCLASGVISQQLANEPDAGFAAGRFTTLTPEIVDMFVRRYPPQEEP
jgi:AcrR family transcriptional regulator